MYASVPLEIGKGCSQHPSEGTWLGFLTGSSKGVLGKQNRTGCASQELIDYYLPTNQQLSAQIRAGAANARPRSIRKIKRS